MRRIAAAGSSLGLRPPVIEEMTGPRRGTKLFGVRRTYFAQSPQQRRSAVEPEELVAGAMLERHRQTFGRHLRQHRRIGAPRCGWIGGKQPALHRSQARHGQPLGPAPDPAGFVLKERPARTGAGIE